MNVQIEITTRCNFDCFYCAGRLMRQADMPWNRFERLLQEHIQRYGTPGIVSLQGEGEPTLHSQFFDMAAHVRALGAEPYTITNGTYKESQRFIGLFKSVGVSIDAMDPSVAQAIGRYNLNRVLRFIDALSDRLAVVIHSVAHETYTPAVAAWCQSRGFRHVVQPLQSKEDYARRYPGQVTAVSSPKFSCSYVASPSMRYYSLDGLEMPCCYIKDITGYRSIDALRQHQEHGTWPPCCAGCRYGIGDGRESKWTHAQNC